MGEDMFTMAMEQGAKNHINMVELKRQSDMATGLSDTQTRIFDLGVRAENAARSVMSDDPKFLDDPNTDAGRIIAQRTAFMRALSDNPEWRSTWSPERVESAIRQDRQRFVNAWAVGNVQRIRDKQGVDAAVTWLKDKVLNADTTLSYNERQSAYSLGISRAQELSEEQRARATASSAALDAMVKLYGAGTPPTEDQYRVALNSAVKSQDLAGADKLRAFHDAYQIISPYARLSPAPGASAVIGAAQSAAPFVPANIERYAAILAPSARRAPRETFNSRATLAPSSRKPSLSAPRRNRCTWAGHPPLRCDPPPKPRPVLRLVVDNGRVIADE
jgi:hypothetical protein